MPPRRIGILDQLAPPRPTWTVDHVPDQTGKVALITGGHRDKGREIARVLLLKGAKVYIASRLLGRIHVVIDDLKRETGKESVFFLNLDLGDLVSIRAAAEEFIGKEPHLHTLYNNAAISYAPTDRETAQGYGVQFGTNVLGHFYLTKLLLPVLAATANVAPPGIVRVVNSSSIVHYIAAPEGIRWVTVINDDSAPIARKKLGITRLNGQSRLGTILFSNELARRYGDLGIVSISLHPGAINKDFSSAATTFSMRARKMVAAVITCRVQGGDSNTVRDGVRHTRDGTFGLERPSGGHTHRPGGISNPAALVNDDPLAAMSIEYDHLPEPSGASYRAITSLYAGTAPEAGRLNGRYLTAWARVTLPHRKALSRDLSAKVWDWCEEQVRDV